MVTNAFRSTVVLPDDAGQIDHHNANVSAEFQIELGIYPEPFIGKREAPVVLLNLNPGLGETDLEFYSKAEPAAHMRKALNHVHVGLPFYFLDPAFMESGGDKWWSQRMRWLIDATDREAVADHVLVVDYFGYKSKKFKALDSPLASQRYAVELAREAMARSAVVVIMRSAKRWKMAVPELAEYPSAHSLSSPQNVALSPKNLGVGWEPVLNAIRG